MKRTYIFKFKLADGTHGLHRQDAKSHFSAFSTTWTTLANQYGLKNVESLLCINLNDEVVLSVVK